MIGAGIEPRTCCSKLRGMIPPNMNAGPGFLPAEWGEMFFEPPGSTHEVSNNASQTEQAKLLAMIFAKKGDKLTVPGHA